MNVKRRTLVKIMKKNARSVGRFHQYMIHTPAIQVKTLLKWFGAKIASIVIVCKDPNTEKQYTFVLFSMQKYSKIFIAITAHQKKGVRENERKFKR